IAIEVAGSDRDRKDPEDVDDRILERAVAVTEEDAHVAIGTRPLTHRGDIRDAILVEVRDQNAAGEYSGGISNRRLERAVAFTKQDAHRAHGKTGIRGGDISETVAIEIGNRGLRRST